MKRKGFKIVLSVFSVILILVGLSYGFYKYFDPYRKVVATYANTKPLDELLEKEEALNDLEYMMKNLRDYHPAFIDGSDIEMVNKQYDIERNQIKDTITVVELWQSAARIFAKLQDGHSRVGIWYQNIGYISDFNEMNKYELLSINDMEVSTLYKQFLEQFSYELESYAEYQFYQYITREDYLNFLNVDTANGVDFKFQTEEGEETFHYEFVKLEDVKNKKIDEGTQDFVRYTIDKENNLGIFTLTECNYNDTYKSTLSNFFSEVKENNIDNIVVDLRHNGGGNSIVADAFFEYINIDSYYIFGGVDIRYGPFIFKNDKQSTINIKKDIVFDGNIYALTSTDTFSSAMAFAVAIQDNKVGVIVGEVPGNMPSSYGDILSFQMPNSQLPITISFKKFRRVDEEKDKLPLIPDYEIDADNALDMVYDLIKG